MAGLKRKNLVIVAMLCVVCSAVYLNSRLQAAEGDPLAATSVLEDGQTSEEEGKILGEAKLVSGSGAADADAAGEGDGQKDEAGADIETAGIVKGDYFAEARVERQTTRDEAKELLQSMSQDTNNTDEVREKAAADLAAIASAIEKEANIETLVKAKGFEDCLAVIGENSVSIMVRSEGISQAELAQIKEIAIDVTALPGASVKIVEIQ